MYLPTDCFMKISLQSTGPVDTIVDNHISQHKKASNHHANLPLEMYIVTTWKPLVLMTRHFDYCPSASEGDNQSVRSSAPVVSRCFPGGYNVKLYISRGRLAWWLLAFLHSNNHIVVILHTCLSKSLHTYSSLNQPIYHTSIASHHIIYMILCIHENPQLSVAKKGLETLTMILMILMFKIKPSSITVLLCKL